MMLTQKMETYMYHLIIYKVATFLTFPQAAIGLLRVVETYIRLKKGMFLGLYLTMLVMMLKMVEFF
ncbi:MAG: hypothetical protein CMJ17_16735 [Phenylobacterium sp.]|nr:hypothetical protein [Phenylobacterium sp.]